jgi:hypothetical protein
MSQASLSEWPAASEDNADNGSLPDVFDHSHYTCTLFQKIMRSFQLGPKYYFVDLPRYFWHRRAHRLPFWDWRAFLNPLKEFRRRTYCALPLPPGYETALHQLYEVGIRLTMPRGRLEALLGAWWSSREVPGEVIECGAYRGATSLLIALLGKLNGVEQTVLMLDTFRGIPETSAYDVTRTAGEFVPPEDATALIHRQAESLSIEDRIETHEGLFADSFAALAERNLRFSLVHLDANIYQGTTDACRFTIPRISPGGVVVFDDYNGVCDLGARLAIDHFCASWRDKPKPLSGSSAMMRVTASGEQS